MSAQHPDKLHKELLLTHFTMENMHEAVFWVDSDANIVQVNQMACQMTGHSKDELLKKKVHELNPSPIVSNFPLFWQKLRKERKITFEAQHKHKTGFLYDVEITGNYIEYNGQEYTCSIVRDIRKRNIEEQLLRFVYCRKVSLKDWVIQKQ